MYLINVAFISLIRLGVGVKAGGLGVIIERKDTIDQGKNILGRGVISSPEFKRC